MTNLTIKPKRRALATIAALAIAAVAALSLAGSAWARDIDPVTVVDISATEGVAFSGQVACFPPPLGSSSAGEFAATIDWGDGTSSAGTISGGGACSSFDYKFSGSHTYAAGGTYTVTVTVTDLTDSSVHTGTGTATVAFVPNDLALSLGASPNPVRTNSNVTYKISVTNGSGNSASGVQVSDSLPSQVQLVSYSASQGSCLAPAVGATGTMSCNLGQLAANATATITVVVKVVAPGKTTITNSAAVSASDPDANSANDSATVTTSVFGRR